MVKYLDMHATCGVVAVLPNCVFSEAQLSTPLVSHLHCTHARILSGVMS